MVNSNNESAIRQIIEARAKAVRAGDVDAMVANVADDVVMFDVIDPLHREGRASSRARLPNGLPPTTARSSGRIAICSSLWTATWHSATRSAG